jgi:23S rRNA (guanosine2251-2'-O)-methyltransferase
MKCSLSGPLIEAHPAVYAIRVQRLTGFHAIEELLRSRKRAPSPNTALRILVSGSGPRIKEILALAERLGIEVQRASKAELDRLAPEHRGILLEAEEGSEREEPDLDTFVLDPPERSLVIVLDHIEDPQNLGAILRSADVFAADLIVAPRKRSAPLGDAAVKASAGAAAYAPLVLVPNLAEALRRLKKAGYWLYSADMGGASLPDADISARSAIVLGNEGAGVSRLLKEECDFSVSIPMSGHVDSLNVSAAAAVLMYEYRRRWPGQGALSIRGR